MTESGTHRRVDMHWLLARWFADNARTLPWRSSTPWGVLVSEVMLQQTPVRRVLPRWMQWMDRWPAPADLAAASQAQVLRAWDRLGYPRRALRLQQAAAAITAEHGGVVPASVDQLRALPGVGEYTAAAVAAFAYRQRTVVLDTNIRRVLARAVGGQALPPVHLTRGERERAEGLLPTGPAEAAEWNAAVMELGALVCTAAAPRCEQCPLAPQCAWLSAGRPPDALAASRRSQPWHGTDRQARGRIMAALRQASGAVRTADLAQIWPDRRQRERALAGLVTDGLAVHSEHGYSLPQ